MDEVMDCSKWISVKSALPEPGQRVLQYGKWRDSGHDYWGAGELVRKDGRKWTPPNVTHWMPLPSPPADPLEERLKALGYIE